VKESRVDIVCDIASCDAGFYCNSDNMGSTWCCPDELTPEQCAGQLDVPGGLTSQIPVPTTTSVAPVVTYAAVPETTPSPSPTPSPTPESYGTVIETETVYETVNFCPATYPSSEVFTSETSSETYPATYPVSAASSTASSIASSASSSASSFASSSASSPAYSAASPSVEVYTAKVVQTVVPVLTPATTATAHNTTTVKATGNYYPTSTYPSMPVQAGASSVQGAMGLTAVMVVAGLAALL
jgi:hypothetical protein